MIAGDRVWWFDPVSDEVKRGTLLEEMLIVAESGFYETRFRDVRRMNWDVAGDDGKRYSVPENELSTNPIAN